MLGHNPKKEQKKTTSTGCIRALTRVELNLFRQLDPFGLRHRHKPHDNN
jgi:hypothetical protein